jgi:AmmeMemoRadiSam system protein B
MTEQIRQPAVAGMFYPADPDELGTMLDDLLSQARPVESNTPKAMIVPHAGYIYSGPVAASAYQLLKHSADKIKRVILLGPSHRVPFHGMATSSASHFATPLGLIPLDQQTINSISHMQGVKLLDEAHAMEHSLEVHLPFLQKTLANFSLVPIVVGEANAREVAEVLRAVWGGDETLIVISSDLSHYHDYQTAKKMDRATSDAIEKLSPDDIGYEDACGRNPVKGLLYLARELGLHARTIDLRNSGDTAGPRDQVVGYGAYTIS